MTSTPLLEPPALRKLVAERLFGKALEEARRQCASAGADPAYAYWIGLAAGYLGRVSEAAPWLELALKANPHDTRAHKALAWLHKLHGDAEGMLAHYRAVLAITPDDPALHALCAEALWMGGRLQEAEREARMGLEKTVNDPVCLAVLAYVIQAQGRVDEAVGLLEASLRTKDDAALRWSLADIYLRAGRYREGFKAYEARRQPGWQGRFVQDPGIALPEWQGGDLAGRRLLVVPEQGLGDTLFALRYARELGNQGGRLSIVVPGPLHRLLRAQPYFVSVYAEGAPISRRNHDCWCFAMSLPALLGEDGSARMQSRAYIAPVPDDAMGLPPRTEPTVRVGLCWAGKPTNTEDARRSIPLERFEPLAGVDGVELYSCQYGADPLPEFVRSTPKPISDFADTSALLSQLDLLITVDTAPAHLAGAMGREVWLLNRWFGDWRWGDSGAATYWYPTMRILRQPRAGDWESVIAEAKALLVNRVSGITPQAAAPAPGTAPR